MPHHVNQIECNSIDENHRRCLPLCKPGRRESIEENVASPPSQAFQDIGRTSFSVIQSSTIRRAHVYTHSSAPPKPFPYRPRPPVGRCGFTDRAATSVDRRSGAGPHQIIGARWAAHQSPSSMRNRSDGRSLKIPPRLPQICRPMAPMVRQLPG